MKKIYLLIIFSVASLAASYAQKEANIWCFGDNCGLDFNSGSPVFLPGVQTMQLEGVSSIADSSGSLLFYTDGMTVWNRNHAVMPNGTGLLGGMSTTQSALIIKQPGTFNIYYIFTPEEIGSGYGFNYSIVDMTLQAGLGNVTIKNSFLLSSCDERVAAVRHKNGQDLWIVVTVGSASSFASYLLTSTGVTLPPVFSSGFYSGDELGYLKSSPAGDKLGIAIHYDGFELFDFDNTTGVVSNPIQMFSANYYWSYGVEFSPDGTRMYGSNYGANNNVWQFDLTAGSPAAIVNSVKLVGSSAGPYACALQLAPDKKIYLARLFSPYLGVINNPNVLGMGCNYVDNGFLFPSGTCQGGLPFFVPDIFTPAALPVANFTSSDTAFCDESGKCIDFTDHSTGSPTAWKWLFPGAIPDTSTQQNPATVCYFIPGTYSVTLIVTNANGTDTITAPSMIIFGNGALAPTITSSNDTLFCSHAASYQWFYNGVPISGATDSIYVAVNDGSYNIYITDDIGCSRFGNGIVWTSINALTDYGSPFTVYPNPVKDQFTVYGLQFTVGATVEIYDMCGGKVYGDASTSLSMTGTSLSMTGTSPSMTVDVSALAKGVYVVLVNTEEKVYRTKIIKQ